MLPLYSTIYNFEWFLTRDGWFIYKVILDDKQIRKHLRQISKKAKTIMYEKINELVDREMRTKVPKAIIGYKIQNRIGCNFLIVEFGGVIIPPCWSLSRSG